MQKLDDGTREEGNAFLMDNIAILSVLQMRREILLLAAVPSKSEVRLDFQPRE